MISEKVKELEQENIALRKQVETLQEICGNLAELPKNCEYCNNFIQHYIKREGSYTPACDGHCIAGHRIKRKSAKDTCKSFVKKEYGKNYIQ